MQMIAHTHDGKPYTAIDGVTPCDFCDQLASHVIGGARKQDVHAVCPTHKQELTRAILLERANAMLQQATRRALGGVA